MNTIGCDCKLMQLQKLPFFNQLLMMLYLRKAYI